MFCQVSWASLLSQDVPQWGRVRAFSQQISMQVPHWNGRQILRAQWVVSVKCLILLTSRTCWKKMKSHSIFWCEASAATVSTLFLCSLHSTKCWIWRSHSVSLKNWIYVKYFINDIIFRSFLTIFFKTVAWLRLWNRLVHLCLPKWLSILFGNICKSFQFQQT